MLFLGANQGIAVLIVEQMPYASPTVGAIQLIAAAIPPVTVAVLLLGAGQHPAIGIAADGHGAVNHRELVGEHLAVAVHVQHGGAVALDRGGLAVRKLAHRDPIHAGHTVRGVRRRPRDLAAHGAGGLRRGVVGVVRLAHRGIGGPGDVGLLKPDDHGIAGLLPAPLGVQGGGSAGRIGEGHLVSVGAVRVRVPAGKGIARAGGGRGFSHSLPGGYRLGGDAGTALGVKVDPVGVLEHRVEIHRAVHRVVKADAADGRTVLLQGPAGQPVVTLGGEGGHIRADRHIVLLGGLDGFHHLAVLIQEVYGVHILVAGIDVVVLIGFGQVGQKVAGGIAVLNGEVRPVQIPAGEHAAVLGGGLGHLDGFIRLQDLGGAGNLPTIRVIEGVGCHIGGADGVDGEVLRREGDAVPAPVPVGVHQLLEEIEHPAQETHGTSDMLHIAAGAVRLRVHMVHTQILIVLEILGLDRHLHAALRLPEVSVAVIDIDIIGGYNLDALHIHADRIGGNRGVLGQVPRHRNRGPVPGVTVDGDTARGKGCRRQQGEHHRQRQDDR